MGDYDEYRWNSEYDDHEVSLRWWKFRDVIEAVTGEPLPPAICSPHKGGWGGSIDADGSVVIVRNSPGVQWAWTKAEGWTQTPVRQSNLPWGALAAMAEAKPKERRLPTRGGRYLYQCEAGVRIHEVRYDKDHGLTVEGVPVADTVGHWGCRADLVFDARSDTP